MALVSIERIAPDVQLGLWRLEERLDDFHIPICTEMISTFHSDARKLERLATHALLHKMTGDSTLLIGHRASGMPFLDGWRLSVSHTQGYVALILSRSRRVAVDIEYFSHRIEHVAHRFIRPDETAQTVTSMLLHWSAKETAYKFYSEECLQYFEMRIHPDTFQREEGSLLMENLKSRRMLSVHYRNHPDYILTYAYSVEESY